jgi:hypothetical protein
VSGIFKKKKNCKYSAKTFALLRGEVLPFLYKAFQVRIIIVGLMVFHHRNYRLRSSHSSTGRCGASFALRRERAAGAEHGPPTGTLPSLPRWHVHQLQALFARRLSSRQISAQCRLTRLFIM